MPEVVHVSNPDVEKPVLQKRVSLVDVYNDQAASATRSKSQGSRPSESAEGNKVAPGDEETVTDDGKVPAALWLRYIWLRVREQLISVSMISGYLFIFYIAMLQKAPPGTIFLGLATAILGISLFMEGFMAGIMPLGEQLGAGLQGKFSLGGAMATTFLLGIACTLAEPAMGALELAGSRVSAVQAPVLWYMLNSWNIYVFLSVGLGVGFAALIGTLRLLRGWSLKIIIYLSTVGTVGLTLITEAAGLPEIIGLAWDSGAVTTGAVTVPIILGLGCGISKSVRMQKGLTEEAEDPLESFGIVTLASLFPIICVLLLGLVCWAVVPTETIQAEAAGKVVADGEGEEALIDSSPLSEIIYATRAVVPLIALLVGLITIKMKEPLPVAVLNIKEVKFVVAGQGGGDEPGCVKINCLVGVCLAYLGMILFNIGLRYGLGPLGDEVGSSVPGLYYRLETVPVSPVVDNEPGGITIVVIFTFFMALVATYAEPALNALGWTTEQLTNGELKKKTLMLAVGNGVGIGVALGVLRTVLDWPLTWMLFVGYIIAVVLTTKSEIKYVCVGWDAAGVTTSSITVPLVLTMGLGLGAQIGRADAFGLLAMGSVGPIILVLAAGIGSAATKGSGTTTVSPEEVVIS